MTGQLLLPNLLPFPKVLRVKIPSTDVMFLPVKSTERLPPAVFICSPQENPVGERLSKYLLALQGVCKVVAKHCWLCKVPLSLLASV